MAKLIEALNPGDKVEGVFIIAQKKVGTKKDGSRYLVLDLADRTGQIPGFIWDDVDYAIKAIADEFFLRISGVVKEYNGRRQVTISSFSRVEPSMIDLNNLFPGPTKGLDALKKRLEELKDLVENPWLKQLLNAIFEDENFYNRFLQLPAAISKHHNYLNGLLDHTIEVAELVLGAQSVFPSLDYDLLLTCALLHDIGKVEEYKVDRGFEFTEKGNLFGHIVIGYSMVRDAIRGIANFPPDLTSKILHIILSHHGREEWGSPRRPAFTEAYLLHFMDNLSSKIHSADED